MTCRTARSKAMLLAGMLLSLLFVIYFVNEARANTYHTAAKITLDKEQTFTDDYYLYANTDKSASGKRWYFIDATSDGNLDLYVRSYFEKDLYIYVYSYDRAKEYKCLYMSEGAEDSPVAGTYKIPLTKGKYFVVFEANCSYYDESSGRVVVKTKFSSYGTNDDNAKSYDSPQVLTLGKRVTGAVTTMDKNDWYKFTVTAFGTYRVGFMFRPYFNYKYTLYNKNLTEKIDVCNYYGGGSKPVTKLKSYILDPGDYYIHLQTNEDSYDSDYGAKYYLNVRVQPIHVTGVSVNKDKATKKVGTKGRLIATVTPKNATDKSVTWTSSNKKVATVDSTGMVTAVGEGTAVITVETKDGKKKASCTVTVPKPEKKADPTPANKAAYEGIWYICPAQTKNLCLYVEDDMTETNKANVELARREDYFSMKWKFTHVGSGYYRISTVDGLVLSVAGNKAVSGTNVRIYSWGKYAGQLWKVEKMGNGLKITPKMSNLSLSFADGKLAVGVNVRIHTTAASMAQRWQLIKAN